LYARHVIIHITGHLLNAFYVDFKFLPEGLKTLQTAPC